VNFKKPYKKLRRPLAENVLATTHNFWQSWNMIQGILCVRCQTKWKSGDPFSS